MDLTSYVAPFSYKKHLLLLVFTSAIFIFCQNSNAQSLDSLRKLNEVHVISKMKATNLFYLSQVLDSSQLQRINSFSIADALRFFSGLQLKDYGGIGGLKTVDVQNMGTQQTGVLYDGVQINDVQNGSVDLGKLSLQNIQEIKLHKGQSSSIFKTASAFSKSNLLVIETKSATFEKHQTQHFQVGIKTGSFALLNPSFAWDQKISKRIVNRFSTEFITANGIYPFRLKTAGYDTVLNRQQADITSIRLENKLSGTLKNNQEWSVLSYFYHSNRGLPGAVLANRLVNTGQRLWNTLFFTQAKLKHQFQQNWTYQGIVKFNQESTKYQDLHWPSSAGVLSNTYLQKEIFLSGTLQYQWKKYMQFSLANDFIFNDLNSNLYQFVFPIRSSNLTALAMQSQIGAFYFQGDLLLNLTKDRTQLAVINRNVQQLLPSFSLAWKPEFLKGFQWNFFYKNTYRLPNFNELYYTLVGNALLKPEKTKQFNTGFQFQKQVFSKSLFNTSISLFYNQVNDKIMAVPSTNLFRWTMLNLEKVSIKGLNFEANWTQMSGASDFRVGINYAYQNAIDQSANSTVYGQLIPYAPLHSGSLNAQYGWKDWSLNYAFVYTGKRYSQKANIPENLLQPWYTHDIGIQKKFMIKKIKYHMGLELNNILNQQFEVVLNYPMPGFNFKFFVNAAI